MSEIVPGALDDLDGAEKNRLYRMLQLEVTPSEEGYEVSGAFCTSGLVSPLARRKEKSVYNGVGNLAPVSTARMLSAATPSLSAAERKGGNSARQQPGRDSP